MHFKIVSVGRVKQKFVLAGEAEYLKRLSSHKVDFIEINDEKFSSMPLEVRKEREAQEVLKLLGDKEYFVALDVKGKPLSSEQFADKISSVVNRSKSKFVFALGGSDGWSKTVLDRADFTLSLSNLTFPHQLTRLILVEQLYRAVSIIKGDPYHK